jgi:hypothetical protein
MTGVEAFSHPQGDRKGTPLLYTNEPLKALDRLPVRFEWPAVRQRLLPLVPNRAATTPTTRCR